MKRTIFIGGIVALALLSGGNAQSQSVNIWRGNETKADWGNAYKWKLKHPPKGDEAVHFRQANSVVSVNETVTLNNGMFLYGRELTLEGNGNIKFWSPVENQNSVYIPASAVGCANLTLAGTLTINGRIALAAKAYGTAASKGSVTMTDRSSISGKLSIGNNGYGSGQVFVRDQAIYHIEDLDLQTVADKGGLAEIHILGGSVRFGKGTNPLEIFLGDSSRKIIMGGGGILTVESGWPVERKKELLIKMIQGRHLIAMPGCRISLPVIQKNTVTLKGELSDTPQDINAFVAQIQKIQPEPEIVEEPQVAASAAPEGNEQVDAPQEQQSKTGYILVLGVLLLAGAGGAVVFVRSRAAKNEAKEAPAESAKAVAAAQKPAARPAAAASAERTTASAGEAERARKIEAQRKAEEEARRKAAALRREEEEARKRAEALKRKEEEARKKAAALKRAEAEKRAAEEIRAAREAEKRGKDAEPFSMPEVPLPEELAADSAPETARSADGAKKDAEKGVDDWLSSHMDLLNEITKKSG